MQETRRCKIVKLRWIGCLKILERNSGKKVYGWLLFQECVHLDASQSRWISAFTRTGKSGPDLINILMIVYKTSHNTLIWMVHLSTWFFSLTNDIRSTTTVARWSVDTTITSNNYKKITHNTDVIRWIKLITNVWLRTVIFICNYTNISTTKQIKTNRCQSVMSLSF